MSPDTGQLVSAIREASFPRLRIKLFGTMAAQTAQGRSVLPRGRKTRAVLGVLALAAGPVLRDQLTQLLWSRREREQARGSLRQAVHELQEQLSPAGHGVLRTERTHLRLDPGAVWVDAHALARDELPGLERLGLFDGALMEELSGLDPAFDRWLDEERRRVMSRAAALAEATLSNAEDLPDVALAAERLLGIDRSHEGAWRALIRVHLCRGERATALATYEQCRVMLTETTGSVPTPETEALFAGIRDCGRPSRVRLSGMHQGEEGLRLGVMPFRAVDSADEALSVGLAEEITTALSRFRWISLISGRSLAALAAEPLAGNPRLEPLGIDALLGGTVQRSGERLRVTVRLLDMRADGEVIWAQRFDRASGDLLTLQDEIAAETAAQVDPELLLREGRRAATQPPSDARAYDLLLQAIAEMYRFEEAAFCRAGDLLAAAAALDPDYATVCAWWAYWHVFLVGQGWAEDPAAAMRRAGELADRAVTRDPSDARALSIAGHVRAFLHRDLEAALELHERALALNPCLPMAWALSGMAHSYAGHHPEAIRRIDKARQLSPFDPHSFIFDMALMIPHLALGEDEKVVELGRRATALNPTLSSTQKGYLSALGHLGRTTEQRAVRDRLLRLEPRFCVREALQRSPFLREADRLRYADGLRLAGLPE